MVQRICSECHLMFSAVACRQFCEKLTEYGCLFMKMLDADYAMADRLFKLRGMDTGEWLDSELHRIHNVFVELGMVG